MSTGTRNWWPLQAHVRLCFNILIGATKKSMSTNWRILCQTVCYKVTNSLYAFSLGWAFLVDVVGGLF